MYPEVVASTPSSLSNGGSMHQKQPPANVATALPGGAAGSFAGCASAVTAPSEHKAMAKRRSARRSV